jgi:tellurium resistance protein TerZ
VDLERVHGPVDTLFLVVTSYHGHSLTWVDGAYVRIRDEDGQAFARFTLTAAPDEPGLLMARLVRGAAGEPWTLHAVGAGLHATTAVAAAALLPAHL